jgi:hypothetical protein|tara:strand:+ start:55 stop:165 length:111 start_codon:yes stop_codon:yes gene_type:complete
VGFGNIEEEKRLLLIALILFVLPCSKNNVKDIYSIK